MKEDELGGACRTRRDEKFVQRLVRKSLREETHFGGLSIM
jgi:hypothetical protein